MQLSSVGVLHTPIGVKSLELLSTLLDELSIFDEDDSAGAMLDELSFFDEDDSTGTMLDELSFFDEDDSAGTMLDELSFFNEDDSAGAMLDELFFFGEDDDSAGSTLDELFFFNEDDDSLESSLEELISKLVFAGLLELSSPHDVKITRKMSMRIFFISPPLSVPSRIADKNNHLFYFSRR